MNLNYEKQYSFLIGDYINNYFDTKILLNFYNEEFIDLFFKVFISNGYLDTINNKFAKGKGENEIYFKKDETIIYGKLYNISELENKENQNINANKINNLTPNGGNKNEQNNNSSNDSNNNAQPTKDIIINDKFLENQIKALISFYLFTGKLKQNIKSSEIIKSECYLIEENWMKKYKDSLLYGNLKQEITNDKINENDKVENIYEKHLNNYLKKIKDNENQICKGIQNIETSKEIDIFESGDINGIIKYNNLRLYIIDKETYKYMNSDPNKKIIISQDKNYIINEGKIFISLSINSISKFEILICTLDSEKNHIIPELVYKYNSIKTNFNLIKIFKLF